jgi:hypothetical protein
MSSISATTRPPFAITVAAALGVAALVASGASLAAQPSGGAQASRPDRAPWILSYNAGAAASAWKLKTARLVNPLIDAVTASLPTTLPNV